ncbi:hypothetical protein GCM10025881_38280 [Pseudolysinimonas kribbensis]|uniref:Uncharacterized protein n=1 Tax=Pseudolysinimonas kribbensis TaxID=433641 RepID=A0ABQ6K9B9_9MICO|nr:hypothetical protein GCM10025881_38280 [Pseudolysinimonas kribbensis]
MAGSQALQHRAQALGEHDAPGGDAEKDERTGDGIRVDRRSLEDLVSDTRDRALDVSLLQHGTCRHPDLLPRLSGRT